MFGRSSQPDPARPAETPTATPSQSGFIAPNNEPPAPAPKPGLGIRSGLTTDEIATSVIGKDLHIGGEKIIIVSESRLQVDGEIVGDIAGREVIIGRTASVTGSVAAERVEVLGKVDGAIRGQNVALQPSARVDGDIVHELLTIAEGAHFDGRVRRAKDPAEVQPTLKLPES